MNKIRNAGFRKPAQILLTVYWLTNLCSTRSYFSIYALVAAASCCCLWETGDRPFPMGKKAFSGAVLFACLLSLAPVLANYELFDTARAVTDLSYASNHFMGQLNGILTFFCGIPVFYEIIRYFVLRTCSPGAHAEAERKHPGRFFLLCGAFILTVDLLYLFCVVYPGNLSHDTMGQLWQIADGVFNNFAPFWHTQLIRLFMGLGYRLFGNANAAAATFCVVQILLMSGVFSYAMMTLYEMQVPKFWLGLSFFLYACLPYNIAFSGSVWKDVPYGAALLLVLTAMYRIFRNMDSHPVRDRVLLTLGGILTCMARTNGVYVMLLTFLIFCLVLRKQMRSILLPWLIVVILGYTMNGPILSALHIERIRDVETVSVPLQQVCLVIAEDGDISPEDREFLNQFMDTQAIKDQIRDFTADPMKDAVMTGDPHFFSQHKGAFFKVWFRTGLKNPGTYLKAWIDLTKGYWNGGYDYYTYAEYIPDNPYGIHTDVSQNLIWRLYKTYFSFTRETILFEPFLSIGLMVWLTWLGFYLSVIHRRKEALLYVPLLAIVIPLWIGAPVYAEFRYTYPLFTAFPLLFPGLLYGSHADSRKALQEEVPQT